MANSLLTRLFGRSPESKVSRTAPLIALAGLGRPVWSDRDTTHLAMLAYGRNAVVYRCVRLVADAVGSIPASVFRDRDELRGHPLERLLLRPNPRQSGRELLENAVTNMLLTGNAYLEMVAEGQTPEELYCLRPDRVKIHPGPDGWPEAYEYAAGGRSVLLRSDGEGIPPVFHLRFFDPFDDHYGQAPLAAAQMPLDVHNAASAWNKALLDNSARPSGALVYAQGGANMTDEQFARLKEELEGAFAGPLNAGRPMLLEGGLDWKPLSLSPKDMDFLEAKSAAAREIALAFGVPPLLLGLPGDNTHANYAEANRALWRQTVIPLARRITEGLAHWLSPAWGGGLRLELDLDQIEALTTEREAKMQALLRADYLTINEKREAIGYTKRPDGDVLVSGRGLRIELGEEGHGVEADGSAARAALARKYADDQARVPAGSAEGGQWTAGGGGGGGTAPDGTIIELVADLAIDLLTEEGGKHGGHTIRDHVGKSEGSLLQSLRERILEILDQGHNASGLRLGSFSSVGAANKLVNATLAANQQAVDDFVASGLPFLRVSAYFESATGIEAYAETLRTKPYIQSTMGTSVILVPNPIAKNRFSILTAFPMK